MTLRVAVDFGTSSTCVALAVDGREPQVVVFDGQPLVPSAVFAGADGTLFVGHEAERQAAIDPARYEPHPKRRIDEGELLLGNAVFGVLDVVRAVLVRAVAEARRVAGGAPVDLLVLTHPADWGAVRTGVLLRAGRGLAQEVVPLPEPVAAAVFHSASHAVADGAALGVLDLGAGTIDASVVRRSAGSFRVLATRGDPTFGGADIDQALLEYVGAQVAGEDGEAWQRLVEGREIADRRRRRVLWQDVRGAKETLSRHPYTDVPMAPPFPDAHVTRGDLERLVLAPLRRAADLAVATVREAGLPPDELAGVFLVGGSSRIPLVARLVQERTGIVPTTLDQPETVVARGALRAVMPGGNHGGLPGPTAPPSGRHTPAHAGEQTEVLAPLTFRPLPGGPGADPRTGLKPGPSARYGLPGRVGDATIAASGYAAATAEGRFAGRAARRSRLPWLTVGPVVAVAAIGATAWALGSAGHAEGRQIAQYDYRFTLPADWQQTGSDAGTRKVQLRPADAPAGDDLIAVQEQLLSYDSTADRERAVGQLREQYQRAGPAFSGFDAAASFAGKDVVHYRQQLGGATVDWYVLFRGTAQVSVGCQYTERGRDRVLAACASSVRSLSVGS